MRLRPPSLAGLVVAGIVLAACGGSDPGGATSDASVTSSPPTVTTTVATHPVALWFLKGAKQVRTTTTAPETVAVARQALLLLLAGPPSGFATAIPASTTLTRVVNVAGVLTADFSGDLTSSADLQAAIDQIAHTALDVGGVTWVQVRAAGKNLGDPPGLIDEQMLDSPDRSDHPPWIELLRAKEIGGKVAYYGTADVFEATVQVRLMADGAAVANDTVTATCGTGCRGTFDGTLAVPAGATSGLVLEAYSVSAEDGKEQNLVRLPVQSGG